MVNTDKDRARMLRALRRGTSKRQTPEERERLAHIVVEAIPPVNEILREAARIRRALK